jgi:hypothetical protein
MADQNLLYMLSACLAGMGMVITFNYFTKTPSDTGLIIKHMDRLSEKNINAINDVREKIGLELIIPGEKTQEGEPWVAEVNTPFSNYVSDPAVTLTKQASPRSLETSNNLSTNGIDWPKSIEHAEFMENAKLFNDTKLKFAKILRDDLKDLKQEGHRLEVPNESEWLMDRLLDPGAIFELTDHSNQIADLLGRIALN